MLLVKAHKYKPNVLFTSRLVVVMENCLSEVS